MRRIAAGGDPTEFNGTQNEALREIGWMHGDRDYFDYTDGCANCGRTYKREQVLMALAFVAALCSEYGKGKENG